MCKTSLQSFVQPCLHVPRFSKGCVKSQAHIVHGFLVSTLNTSLGFSALHARSCAPFVCMIPNLVHAGCRRRYCCCMKSLQQYPALCRYVLLQLLASPSHAVNRPAARISTSTRTSVHMHTETDLLGEELYFGVAAGDSCQTDRSMTHGLLDGKGLPLPVEVAVPLMWPAICDIQRLVLHSTRTT